MDTFLTPIIAKKLKDFRKEKKWSQEVVAEHLGISQSTYARIEKGLCNTWLLHLKDICSLYQLELNTFLNINSQENSIQKKRQKRLTIKKLVSHYELRLQEKDIYISSLEKELLAIKKSEIL
ncbi:helix-turn-helix domain-containing protein [Polaribacter cellanae]|uniref:Helix-turn-helix domain-containing protein n=1 Tax=Polaribacter cellanae TaxID=2818493 RepID=A0A975CR51_9FLAO|nr:helix-turn-helix domain-containing protein [Polaribacter cellanae]QTE22377.1 helix-turn-helix domain-containing protein [Polaribacter cellanae]